MVGNIGSKRDEERPERPEATQSIGRQMNVE